MKYILTLILTLAVFLPSHAKPEKEVSCRACHGVSGASPVAPNYPKLNGQNKAYLISSLKAYRDGQRTGGIAVVMSTQAVQLSDADIEELADYYSAQQ